jgi:ABC-type transport system involved in cytochrome c biogenesis permease subunit
MKRVLPWIVVALAALFVAGVFLRRESATEYHYKELGRIPVLLNGRIKPLDTVARTSLMIIHGKQTARLPGGERMPAIAWLTELMIKPEVANQRPVFLIHDPDVLGILGIQGDRKLFSFDELEPGLGEVERQARQASEVEALVRTRFQKHVLDLHRQVTLFYRLRNSIQPDDSPDFGREVSAYMQMIGPGLEAMRQRENGEAFDERAFDALIAFASRYQELGHAAYLHIAPPIDPATTAENWQTIGHALLDTVRSGALHPSAAAYAALASAYRAEDFEAFNQQVSSYRAWLDARQPTAVGKANLETFFNQLAPFYKSMALYVGVFLLACFSWLGWQQTLGRSALWLASLALVLHTGGIILRMVLEGRPPVTNLYSSAVFVGWGSVGLGLILERIYRNGIGSAAAAAVGFTTLVVAHHLSGDGDTMEMMRAVLDSNFWLATHVIVITLGYSAMFLAGFIALVYLMLGVFTKLVTAEGSRVANRMVYGIICFATLFSFTGTVLGGIWADQSWGRFWGWDPKENGALLIVLWCAIILHARWGGYIRERGLMSMAIFGNVVTAWSWFGTNMLGIGLHSYGFMDKAFVWLMVFMVSQGLVMTLAIVPTSAWRSSIGRNPRT